MNNGSGRVALITGIAGFCGSHLAERLLQEGWEVAGIEQPGASTQNLAAILGRLRLYCADLRDREALRQALAEMRPAQVYHLAAVRPPSDAEWRALFDVNVYGTIHLMEAVRAECPGATVLVSGSAAEYGLVPAEENPIREETPFRPITPYGVSKVTQEMIAFRYGAAVGLRVIRTRAFNIVGPRQGADLAASAFARQIAAIEAGRQEPVVEVGNLFAQRDFVDVRDAVRAYVLAVEEGTPGAVYNVCSGEARTIAAVLEGLLALSVVRGITVRQDPARVQPADVPLQVGDCRRLREQTGWQPEIPFSQTLRDLLDDWRTRTGA